MNTTHSTRTCALLLAAAAMALLAACSGGKLGLGKRNATADSIDAVTFSTQLPKGWTLRPDTVFTPDFSSQIYMERSGSDSLSQEVLNVNSVPYAFDPQEYLRTDITNDRYSIYMGSQGQSQITDTVIAGIKCVATAYKTSILNKAYQCLTICYVREGNTFLLYYMAMDGAERQLDKVLATFHYKKAKAMTVADYAKRFNEAARFNADSTSGSINDWRIRSVAISDTGKLATFTYAINNTNARPVHDGKGGDYRIPYLLGLKDMYATNPFMNLLMKGGYDIKVVLNRTSGDNMANFTIQHNEYQGVLAGQGGKRNESKK